MHKQHKNLNQYMMVHKYFHGATQQPYFKQTEEMACQIFYAYRNAYRSILNDIYKNTTIQGNLYGIFNEDISDAFKKANPPVGLFQKQFENRDLRCFSGDVGHLSVRFDCENNRFLISDYNSDWDYSFEYPLTVEEFQKSLEEGHIDNVMSKYKEEVENIIYKNIQLEQKRSQRLREKFMLENIERG